MKFGKYILGDDSLSQKISRNILISFMSKGICILCSLLIVPLTINYVNSTQYGIWLTISSIIAWVAYFDLGIGNGFRNRFAEAVAEGDSTLARQYVSTAYFSIGVIVFIPYIVLMLANQYIDWTSVLHVDIGNPCELNITFGIILSFFCLNMVANLFMTLVTANQEPGVASIINAVGQMLSLIVIFALTKCCPSGSLVKLSIFFSGVPVIVTIVSAIYAFSSTKYSAFAPKIRFIKLSLVKDILSMGVKFFIVCISMVFIFQMTNVILSREIGPEAVTEYNIAFKYFSILYSVLIIVITPYWSAFTDAFSRKDYNWMIRSISKLEKIMLGVVITALVMLCVSPLFYRIWVGGKVTVAFATSVSMTLFVISQSFANTYMYIINGIGTIRIQLVIYLISAMVSWPLLVLSCRYLGVWGILLLPIITYTLQAIFGKIQISRLMSGQADGWWGK